MPDHKPPQPAATVLLVRQVDKFEVLMVKRHHQIDFASGALVFPGGKLDPDDAGSDWDDLVEAPEGLGAVERGLRIAALREAFEESGLLLARTARGGAFAAPEALSGLHEQRDAIAAGKTSFRQAIRDAGLILALDGLHRFAHWITPEGIGRRFDTHFFIAAAPDDQVAACDGWEAVEAVWLEPEAALAEGRAGLRQIIFPTRLNLEKLAESRSVDEALGAARARTIVTVTPRIISEDGTRVLVIPEEAGYSVTREIFTNAP
jgi:8-oxo-dGTP pyrophosphatase MutT (NUDIX family)